MTRFTLIGLLGLSLSLTGCESKPSPTAGPQQLPPPVKSPIPLSSPSTRPSLAPPRHGFSSRPPTSTPLSSNSTTPQSYVLTSAGTGYLIPTPVPGTQISLPVTRPAPHFEQNYSRSEAEQYKTEYDRRHSDPIGLYLNNVQLDGQFIDITSENISDQSDTEHGYQIFSLGFRDFLRANLDTSGFTRYPSAGLHIPLELGDILPQSLLTENEVINDALFLDVNFTLNDDYLQRLNVFMIERNLPPSLSQESQTYLDFLRGTIVSKLRALDHSHGNTWHSGAHYYVNNQYGTSAGIGIWVHRNTPNTSAYQGTLFFNMLEAISQNNEFLFLQSLLDLATAFHPGNAEARSGLIDTYTSLFVAKRFPSPALRQRYLHYTLRCGHLH